jgi:hypothetical protein
MELKNWFPYRALIPVENQTVEIPVAASWRSLSMLASVSKPPETFSFFPHYFQQKFWMHFPHAPPILLSLATLTIFYEEYKFGNSFEITVFLDVICCVVSK